MATVQALERGIDLLELVLQSPHGLTLNELAERLHVAPPTAFNLATTLINKGFLKKTGRPVTYQPGDKLASLQPVRSVALDFSSYLELRDEIGAESLLITKAIDGDTLIKIRINVQRPTVVETPDRLVPSPYVFASSLCILAFLSGEERAHYRKRYPFPMYGPPLWERETELDDFLKTAATVGHCFPKFANPPRIAVPIWGKGNTLWGSLGASFDHPITKDQVQNSLRLMHQAATNTPALS